MVSKIVLQFSYLSRSTKKKGRGFFVRRCLMLTTCNIERLTFSKEDFISSHYVDGWRSEGVFTLCLVGVKLWFFGGSQKVNYLMKAIRGVGLDFGVFLSGFAMKTVLSNEINKCFN